MRALSGKARGAVAAFALVLVVLGPGAGEARGSPGWHWPVEGRVITAFANDGANPYAGGMHRGIDIAAPEGTAVKAARTGEVTYAGALGYSGLTVAVRTADGYVTSYLHLAAVSVRRGQALDAGDRVGAVGTTGRRSKPEPHLHFGVRHAGEENGYVDPLSLLPPLPGPAAAGAPVAVPAPVPVAPQEAPARVRPEHARERVAAPRRVAQPHGVAVHPPLPVPVAASPPARRVSRPRPVAPAARHRVPVAPGSRPAPRNQPARAAPARAHAPEPARDWGRPIALAGLALVLLALFGPRLVRQALRLREIRHGAPKRRAWRGILRGAT